MCGVPSTATETVPWMDFSCSVNYAALSSATGPYISLWRATKIPGNSLSWLGVSTGPFGNSSVRCDPFLALEASVEGERRLAGTCVSPLFGDSIYISFAVVIF